MRVDKETAIALRDLGYSKPTGAHYRDNHLAKCFTPAFAENWNDSDGRFISAPTLEEVVEWLDEQGVYVISKLEISYKEGEDCKDSWMYMIVVKHKAKYTAAGFPSRSSATLAGIKKAIEIKSQQNKKA